MRYADPSCCPDCRQPMPAGATSCPSCGLLLRHRLGVELFATLSHADGLIDQLRVLSGGARATGTPPPAPAAASPAPTPAPIPAAPLPASAPAAPLRTPGASSDPMPPPPPALRTPGLQPAPARGLAASSVPKVLLGLGALCLLVAAIVFLAVSWSHLGVGGRTAVLGALTVTFAAAALGLHRVGLRIAGESLSVVALGLLALDVVGAGAAGWLGAAEEDAVVAVAGFTVAAVAAAFGTLRLGGQPRLVAPQVCSGLAVLTGYVGAASATGHPWWTGAIVAAVALGATVLAGRVDLPALAWSVGLAGGFAWVITVLGALAESLADPTAERLWVAGTGWSLLTSAALALAAGFLLFRGPLRIASASIAALLATGAATLPLVDAGATTVAVASLGVTAAWAAVLLLVGSGRRHVATAPAVVGAALLLAQVLTGGGVAVARWGELLDDLDRPFDVVLRRPETIVEPLLLVPAMLVILVVALALTGDRSLARVRGWLPGTGVAAGLALAVTLASYDVALLAVLAVLAVIALASAAGAALRSGTGALLLAITALALAFATVLGAVPSPALRVAAAAVLAIVAVAVAVAPDAQARVTGGFALAPSGAVLVGAVVSATDLGAGWLALPTLVVVGAVMLARPLLEVALPGCVVTLLALVISVGVADRPSDLVAVWLVVAGVLTAAAGLLRRAHRAALAATPVLWVLASWVWLADQRVTAPEPYALPAALLLLALGLVRMRRDASMGTPEALAPALVVGLVPSLWWVLDDPVSLRALLLGAACLGTTLAGAVLRWSAPLLVGATVGGLLVLRELGPYAGEIPQWVWIGLAGTLLTLVGITWERQLLEVRRAVSVLSRLR